MDDEQLHQELRRLASAAVEASQGHTTPPPADRPRLLVGAVAALVALVVLGAVILVGIRRSDGIDVTTQPGRLGGSTTAPSTDLRSPGILVLPTLPPGVDTLPVPHGGSTNPLPSVADRPLPGRELFRRPSVNGDVVVVGQLVHAPDECAGEIPLGCLGRSGDLLYTFVVVRGQLAVSGGGAAIAPPSVPIASIDGGGASDLTGEPDVNYELFVTTADVDQVEADVRQPDGSMVTQAVSPARTPDGTGVVAILTGPHGDILGPVRAERRTGQLLGTADAHRVPGG